MLEGQPIEIRLASEGIYPCDGSCPSDKIRAYDGTRGCHLKFSRETTTTMTRENLSGNDCDKTRDQSWGATANDFPNSNDVFLKIKAAHPDDR